MNDDDRRPPRALTPREAMERFIANRRPEAADATIQSYYYRLKLFVEWCEFNDIERVDQLDGWAIDSFETYRRGAGVSPSTLKNELSTLRELFKYLERLDVVDGLADVVKIPTVPPEQQSDETHLAQGDALSLLEYYRTTPSQYGRRGHTYLELAWHIGARVGGLRALDIRDADLDEAFVEFHHRDGSPLKNGPSTYPIGGERIVGIPDAVADVIETYIDQHRYDVHDDAGRQPLLSSRAGRPRPGTIREWSYRATFPCHHTECPHGKDPATCEYKETHKGSQCPSSRSPHQVRTGSIMWQRDLGFPPEVVAERVNASLGTIEQHYDKESPRERMERRRRPYITEHMETHDTDTTDDE